MGSIVSLKKPVVIRLECTPCGVQQDAGCNCGVGYVPTKSMAAAQAIAANPEKSNRAIAKQIGADKVIVDRARKQLGTVSPVDKRIGLDGKSRSQPRPTAPRVTDPAEVRGMARYTLREAVLDLTALAPFYDEDELLKNVPLTIDEIGDTVSFLLRLASVGNLKRARREA